MSDSQNSQIKSILVRAISQIDFPADAMKQVPLPLRAMLGGKNPVEFVGGLIQKMPDEYTPYIIAVAKAITDAAG